MATVPVGNLYGVVLSVKKPWIGRSTGCRNYSLAAGTDDPAHIPQSSYLPPHVLQGATRASGAGPLWNGKNELPEPEPEHKGISDREWEMRTGRAVDILQQTLPGFFSTGLISAAQPSSEDKSNVTDIDDKGKARMSEGKEQGIYSRRVKLEYTPPVALPAPFPRVLTVEGLPLYVASSVFVRHTLNALYTDLEVHIVKLTIKPPLLGTGTETYKRDKSVIIRKSVSGTSRMSGSRAEWDVVSTYSFSPRTGLVAVHTVNSIHPAPHETVYDALQSSLAKLRLAGSGGGNQKGVEGAMSTAATNLSRTAGNVCSREIGRDSR